MVILVAFQRFTPDLRHAVPCALRHEMLLRRHGTACETPERSRIFARDSGESLEQESRCGSCSVGSSREARAATFPPARE